MANPFQDSSTKPAKSAPSAKGTRTRNLVRSAKLKKEAGAIDVAGGPTVHWRFHEGPGMGNMPGVARLEGCYMATVEDRWVRLKWVGGDKRPAGRVGETLIPIENFLQIELWED